MRGRRRAARKRGGQAWVRGRWRGCVAEGASARNPSLSPHAAPNPSTVPTTAAATAAALLHMLLLRQGRLCHLRQRPHCGGCITR
eukprot:698616-Pelagomonas_calceolata.AAC.3